METNSNLNQYIAIDAFIELASTRNKCNFEITGYVMNYYENVIGIRGEVEIDGVFVPTEWRIDGINAISEHQYHYDLIKVLTPEVFKELIEASSETPESQNASTPPTGRPGVDMA